MRDNIESGPEVLKKVDNWQVLGASYKWGQLQATITELNAKLEKEGSDERWRLPSVDELTEYFSKITNLLKNIEQSRKQINEDPCKVDLRLDFNQANWLDRGLWATGKDTQDIKRFGIYNDGRIYVEDGKPGKILYSSYSRDERPLYDSSDDSDESQNGAFLVKSTI